MDASKNEYEEAINLLQWQNEMNKNRYRLWRTIATVSMAINGFVFGFFIGTFIFR